MKMNSCTELCFDRQTVTKLFFPPFNSSSYNHSFSRNKTLYETGTSCLCVHTDVFAYLNSYDSLLKVHWRGMKLEKSPLTVLYPSLFQEHNAAFIREERGCLCVSVIQFIYLSIQLCLYSDCTTVIPDGLLRHCQLNSGICCCVSVQGCLCFLTANLICSNSENTIRTQHIHE